MLREKGLKFIDDQFDVSREVGFNFRCTDRTSTHTFDAATQLQWVSRDCKCVGGKAHCKRTLACGKLVSWRGPAGIVLEAEDLDNVGWDWKREHAWISRTLPDGGEGGWGKVSWNRVSDATLWGKSVPSCVVDESVGAADIEQGQLGNCWMCACFASIASAHPKALRSIFSPSPRLSPEGVFSVRLILDGRVRYMLLDDFVLCKGGSGGESPSVHSANESEMWPRLLEKAVAKLGRRMMAVEGGTEKPAKHLALYPHDVLGYLIGGTDHGWLSLDGDTSRCGESGFDPAAKLAGFAAKGYVLTCGSRNTKAKDDTERTELGIVGYHACDRRELNPQGPARAAACGQGWRSLRVSLQVLSAVARRGSGREGSTTADRTRDLHERTNRSPSLVRALPH